MSARKKPGIVYENGKPVKVILDIKQYQQMLEELEDWDEIKALEEIRKNPLNLRTFSDLLAARSQPLTPDGSTIREE